MRDISSWGLGFLLVLSAPGCTPRKQVADLSLIAVHVEDTVLYDKLSFVISIKNNLAEPVDLFFQRENPPLGQQSDISRDMKVRLVLTGKDGTPLYPLKLLAVYPEDIHLKGKDSLVLAFIGKCPGFLHPLQQTGRQQTGREIQALFRTNAIYCYDLVPGDTIRVIPKQDLPVSFQPLYVDDLKKLK